jgi:dipeptidyl aminopeptidase/acylaminoacyl peptidase
MRRVSRLLVLVLALALLPASGVGAARAASIRADEVPSDLGTYLVELASGRLIYLSEHALVAWAPDGNLLAVADTRGDPVEARLRLISMPPPASVAPAERIVELADRGEINQLKWSPDGSRLAFTLSRFGRDAGPSLSVVDPTTAKARELVRSSVGEIAWRPDSKSISAITLGINAGSIVTLNAATGAVEQTVLDGSEALCQIGLAWSPDGKQLAYAGPGLREGCGDVGNWGLWTWEPATKTTRHLFTGASEQPRWLANGNLVAMVSMPRPERLPQLTLLRYEAVGSEPRPIADDIPRMFPQPARMVQTVGSTLMYAVSGCDEAAAYTWNPGQPSATRQTPSDTYAYGPALGSDGKQLAYIRVSDDASDLVVAPLGGGEPRVILTSTELGLQVGTQGPWGAGGDWSPDGKWLAVELTSEQFRDCVN